MCVCVYIVNLNCSISCRTSTHLTQRNTGNQHIVMGGGGGGGGNRISRILLMT